MAVAIPGGRGLTEIQLDPVEGGARAVRAGGVGFGLLVGEGIGGAGRGSKGFESLQGG